MSNKFIQMYRDVVNLTRGLTGAYIAYPIAERFEKRDIRSKVKELRKYYKYSLTHREVIMRERLVETLQFAGANVPYYKELFAQKHFDPEKLRRDIAYFQELPYLTKDIIREQGMRLLSKPLQDMRHHVRKTGGSTGPSAVIYYDQESLDYSAAVTLFCRERIGAMHYKPEIHFAASFAKPPKTLFPTKDDMKNLSLNRGNIFFDRLDEQGFESMLESLFERRPYLVHAHPSTIFALACFIEQRYGKTHLFEIFESSGELFRPYMRQKIEQAMNCLTIDRYGLAEFGIIAYELDGAQKGLQILDSEGWAEDRTTDEGAEFVFTGFRNRLMPLIRYCTGDMGKVEVQGTDPAMIMTNLVGRIHDVVYLGDTPYPTHHIMDVLDHTVGGVREFQIDVSKKPPILRLAIEQGVDEQQVKQKIDSYWNHGFVVEICDFEHFTRVGRNSKFRYVVGK